MSWLFSQALMDRYANSPCSQVPAEESSAEPCSAGEPSVPSSSTPTQRAYLWRDKTTDAWSRFPSGVTCEPLTADRGEDVLTSFLGAFPAKTSVQPEKALESTESEADCGQKWRESLAKFDPASRSWKTRQCLLLGGLAEFSETWPRWGSMRSGACSEDAAQDCNTSEPDCGWWPTPQRMDGTKLRLTQTVASWIGQRDACKSRKVHKQYPLGVAVRIGGGESKARKLLAGGEWKKNQTGYQSADWTEWLMTWPVGWTDLRPLGTGKFRAWLHSHGELLRKEVDE